MNFEISSVLSYKYIKHYLPFNRKVIHLLEIEIRRTPPICVIGRISFCQ